jgi:hypothetical protein
VVTPSSLTLQPGETQTFTVTMTRTSAALNSYTGGQLTWTGGGYKRPQPHRGPPGGPGRPGSGRQAARSYNVTFGYSGAFSATHARAVPGHHVPGHRADDPTDTFVLAVRRTVS